MKPDSNWLKTLREKARLKQEDLAARLQLAGLEYARSSISAWENGYANPPLESVEFRQALANIFNMDIKTILKLAGYEVDSRPHTDEAERVAWLIDQLPTEKRNLAVRLVEGVIEELAKT